MLEHSFSLAVQSALALAVSHGVCCGIIMHFDLSGKWAKYTLHKTRCVSVQDYLDGAKSFVADLFLLFLPVMTLCYYFRETEIRGRY
jgi:cytochrome bd-type quinol oxidase subunit 1